MERAIDYVADRSLHLLDVHFCHIEHVFCGYKHVLDLLAVFAPVSIVCRARFPVSILAHLRWLA